METKDVIEFFKTRTKTPVVATYAAYFVYFNWKKFLYAIKIQPSPVSSKITSAINQIDEIPLIICMPLIFATVSLGAIPLLNHLYNLAFKKLSIASENIASEKRKNIDKNKRDEALLKAEAKNISDLRLKVEQLTRDLESNVNFLERHRLMIEDLEGKNKSAGIETTRVKDSLEKEKRTKDLYRTMFSQMAQNIESLKEEQNVIYIKEEVRRAKDFIVDNIKKLEEEYESKLKIKI